MKFIAHRGLVDGPNKELENNPDHILTVLNSGIDCEVDLWVNGNELWLGHDEPQYKIQPHLIHKGGLWVHAKNLEALRWLLKNTGITSFWHQNDDFVVTNSGHIWTFPGKELTDRSICVMPERDDNWKNTITSLKCYGICSDYINEIKLILG
jgi:hypothetical protein